MFVEDKDLKRFFSKVNITSACWIWIAGKSQGYGDFRYHGKIRKAHRLIYEWKRGPVAKDLVIDHLCRNRACVNPDHLEVVTNRENIMRGMGIAAVCARKTHCINGHVFNNKNSILVKNGRRFRLCKICNAQSKKKWALENSAKVRASIVKYNRRYPQRIKAYMYLNNAVRDGKIQRSLICDVCGNAGKIEAHHYKGYAKRFWFNVQWMCKVCHGKTRRYKNVAV